MGNVFDPNVKREKVHWMQGRRERATIDAWKQVATIGSLVVYHDETHEVESHPGLNDKSEACVFISGVEVPVPLRLLYLAGGEAKPPAKKKDAESFNCPVCLKTHRKDVLCF